MAIFTSTAIVSCDDGDDVVYEDYDTYAKAFDIKNVNLSPLNGSATLYQYNTGLPLNLIEMDMVLVYRLVDSGTTSTGNIWEQIPITRFTNGGEIDFAFEFGDNYVQIFADANYPLVGDPFVTNQTFRVLMVPASQAKTAQINYSDYNAVIKHFNIDESKIK